MSLEFAIEIGIFGGSIKIQMAKGDKKTKRGKITAGSYGKSRPKKVKKKEKDKVKIKVKIKAKKA